jgi:hypothetical protein
MTQSAPSARRSPINHKCIVVPIALGVVVGSAPTSGVEVEVKSEHTFWHSGDLEYEFYLIDICMKVASVNPVEIHDTKEWMLCEVRSSGCPSRGDKIAHASNRQNDEDMVTFAGYTSL